MDDYISREAALEAVCADCSEKMRSLCELDSNHCKKYNAVKSVPPADVRPMKEGENITENNPVDEFVCSKCGIILEDWSRVEIDEDDGERTNHEYVFQFCPNCGVKLKEDT